MEVPTGGTIRSAFRRIRPLIELAPQRMQTGLQAARRKSSTAHPQSAALPRDTPRRPEDGKYLSGVNRTNGNRKEIKWQTSLRRCRWPRRGGEYLAQRPRSRWPELGPLTAEDVPPSSS